ncbi:hypothetical protein [Ilumatobacter sp.]|uniref:hypothetical protein n=1 Tax=Ilumatobacter sp. TaxID=1967498 RepID=UPI003C734CE2
MLAGLATLSACTDATTEPAGTAAVPAPETADVATDPSERCEDQVVLDEYGFPVEFELCAPTGDDAEDMSPTALLSRVPSEQTRSALDAGHEAALRLASDCDDAPNWSMQADRLLGGLQATTELVRTDPEVADWIGGPDARALADEFRDLLIFPSGCGDDDGTGDGDGNADPAATLATAGRLAGINDDLGFALDASEQILFDSDFWYATDQIGHLVDTTLLLESAPIDVLLMGASTVKRGIDPVQLSQATGQTVYNAAVGALAPDLQSSWYRELRASGVQPSTVVLGLNTWIEFLECESPQKDRVAATDERRSRAFAGIADLANVPTGERLVGGDPPSYAGRALQAHRETWLPGTGGRLELSDDYQQAIADTQADTYRDLPYDSLCPDRLDRIAALADEITADGSDVVFMVLPTSDAVVGFHPDGRAGHEIVLDEYRAIAAATGAQFVDTSDLVDDDLYVDLTHVGNPGRALITDALAQALAPGGTPA